MSKRYSGKSFKYASLMKQAKLSLKDSFAFFITLESLKDLPLYLFDIYNLTPAPFKNFAFSSSGSLGLAGRSKLSNFLIL